MRGQSLQQEFDTRPNALHAVRLVLAMAVVLWHAHLLPDGRGLWRPGEQLLAQLPVDAFFSVSGFLIVRSWKRDSDGLRFLAARFLRLFPGLWTCLIVSAFVIVPVALAVAGRGPMTWFSQVDYVLGNATTLAWAEHLTIEDATVELNRSAINVSLWSLRWEVFCYFGVLVLGVTGLLKRRVMVGIAAVAWGLSLSWVMIGIPHDVVLGIWPGPRLVLMFATGALLYFYSDRVRPSRAIASLAVGAVVVGAFLPDYRLIAAPAVAYLALTGSLWLGRARVLRLRQDLSYGIYVYGAPIQQALIIAGVTGLSWPMFSVVSLVLVLPLAAASWFLVERPVMRLRRLRPRGATPGEALVQTSRTLADPHILVDDACTADRDKHVARVVA